MKESNSLTLQNSLQQKLVLSQLNPHMIFNALTAMQHFVMLDDKIKANHYLSQLSQFIRQVLQDARNVFISIEKEKSRLEKYLELERERFDKRFEYKIALNGKFSGIPSMLIFPFVEEALYERVLFDASRKKKRKLWITFDNEPDSTCITIVDNGMVRNSVEKSAGILLAEQQIQAYNECSGKQIILERKTYYGINYVTLQIPNSQLQ